MEKEISRRQFICGLGVGLLSLGLTGCGLNTTGNRGETTGNKSTPASASPYDRSKVIVAEGTEQNFLIKKGLKALGGIDKLVKKGSSVVIKPNFSVPGTPGSGTTTNHLLVAAVVKQCLTAGAKEVKVIDYPFSSSRCLTSSGIKEAVEGAGGKAFNINAKSFYTEVDMGGTILKNVLFKNRFGGKKSITSTGSTSRGGVHICL